MKFAIVGFATNAAGYTAYLLITYLGADPKLSMTALYILGTSLGFWANRQWVFSHNGAITKSAMRYGAVYLTGYAINWTMLSILVDRMHYSHAWVQAVATLIVAAILFVLMRVFVFPDRWRHEVMS